MEKRFRLLRAIATILKILAWVTLVCGLLGGGIMAVTGLVSAVSGRAGLRLPRSGLATGPMIGWLVRLEGPAGRVLTGISLGIGAVLNWLFFYAAGEGIYLALAIEENTREACYHLKGGAVPRQV